MKSLFLAMLILVGVATAFASEIRLHLPAGSALQVSLDGEYLIRKVKPTFRVRLFADTQTQDLKKMEAKLVEEMESESEKFRDLLVNALEEIFPNKASCRYSFRPTKILRNQILEYQLRTDRCVLEFAEGWQDFSNREISKNEDFTLGFFGLMDAGSSYCLDFCQPVRVKAGDTIPAEELRMSFENAIMKFSEMMENSDEEFELVFERVVGENFRYQVVQVGQDNITLKLIGTATYQSLFRSDEGFSFMLTLTFNLDINYYYKPSMRFFSRVENLSRINMDAFLYGAVEEGKLMVSLPSIAVIEIRENLSYNLTGGQR